jgi:hypothetical protein
MYPEAGALCSLFEAKSKATFSLAGSEAEAVGGLLALQKHR